MTRTEQEIFSKVPEVTTIFWIVKILATTLGETGGDAVSMSMNLGYLVSSGIFAVIFIVAVTAQIYSKKFQPILYWTTIIATTTLGTTLADIPHPTVLGGIHSDSSARRGCRRLPR